MIQAGTYWPWFRAFLAAIYVLMSLSGAQADTPLSGTVQGTLSLAGSPYNVSGRLTVPAGSSLVIDAGVVLRFQDRAALVVEGSLTVNGAAGQPVVFQPVSSTSPGAWSGVGVMEGASAVVRYAVIRYAGTPGGFTVPGQLPKAAALFVYRGSVDVADTELSASAGDGFYYYNDSQSSRQLRLVNNLVTACSANALNAEVVDPADTITTSGNNLTNCGAYAIRVNASGLGRFASDNVMTGNTLGNGVAVTGGSIAGSVTLAPNKTWFILGQLTIPAGATLSVSAGDAVRFRGGVVLLVQGTLNVTATDYSPAALYADAPSPSGVTRWAGVFFAEGSTGNLEHVIVSGAGYANAFQIPGVSGYRTASICAYRADLSLHTVSILNSGGDAVYWYNDGPPHSLNIASGDITTTENDGYVVASETAADAISITGTVITLVQRYPLLLPAQRLPDLSGNELSGSAIPAVAVNGGNLSRNAELAPEGLYLALQPFTVEDTAVLTVAHGCTLRFAPTAWLEVFGTLRCTGTAVKPVTFTSFFPNPLPGDWGGVLLAPGAVGSFDHTCVCYAGKEDIFLVSGVGSVQAGIVVDRADLSAIGLSSSHNAGHGLYLYNGSLPARTVSVTGGDFSHNSLDGMHIHRTTAGDNITLTDLSANSNGGDGLWMRSLSGVPAVASLRADGNAGFPVRTPPVVLASVTSVSFTGNALGDQVALTAGSIAGTVTVDYALRLLGVVDVPAGAVLNLRPGADVTGESLSALQVKGSLSVEGTSASPIRFHGPPSAGAGAWGGIGFLEGSSAVVAGAHIDAAGESDAFVVPLYSSPAAGVLAYRANVSITDCSVTRSGGDGVLLINDGTVARTMTLASSSITSATGAGVKLAASRGDDALYLSALDVNGCGGVGISLPMRSLYGFGPGCEFSGNAGGNGVRITAPSADAGMLYRDAAVPAGTTLYLSATAGVSAGAALTLGAGTTIRAASGRALLVSGTLQASGRPELPVTFTADVEAPSAGSWGGIGFGPGSRGILNNAEIRYAGASYTVPGGTSAAAGVAAVSADVTLNGCLFRDNTGSVMLRGTANVLTSANTTFTDPGMGTTPGFVNASGSGSGVFGGSAADGCDFLSTRDSAVVNAGPATLAARYCFWGAADGPKPAGSGAGTSGPVDTTPFGVMPVNAPAASFTLPIGQTRGVLNVTGTASSPYFVSAVLEAGYTEQPSSYSLVGTHSSPVTAGELGAWDTSSLAEGVWTLRLTVTDRLGRTTAASQMVTLGNGAPGSGDLDGNGVPDAGDAALALRFSGGLAAPTAAVTSAGDVSPQPVVDGRISLDDVVAILRKAVSG